MSMLRFSSFVLALASFSLAGLAGAQAGGADKASAEALFNEGLALVAGGKYAEGCRKLEGSQALDATLGTELRLADCYERQGLTASAWATFKHAQGVAHVQAQSEREELARLRFEALEPKLSYLDLNVEGTPLPGLSVTRNGREVPLASLGVAIPVDPGEQRIIASAPGYEPWQQTLVVAPGPGQRALVIPPLEKREASRAAIEKAPAQAEPERSTQRAVGIVTSVVGLASLLAGGGLGLYAKVEGDRSKQDQFCPSDDHNGCTPEGVDLRDRARTAGSASTITFIAGAALLTTGVVLWTTAPSTPERPSQARLQLRASGSGATLRGNW
jgi:hypothetical protein